MGTLAQGKPCVLTEFIFSDFFLLWFKKFEVQKPLRRQAVYFNGTRMDLKTIRPLACLCWRTLKPNRAIKTVLCSAITLSDAAAASSPPLEKCLLNLGACRGYYKSLWLTFARLAASPERKTHSYSGSGLSLLCSFQAPALLSFHFPLELSRAALFWAAAGSIPRMPNHQCASEGGGWYGKTRLEFPLCHPTGRPHPPELSSWHLSHFPTDFQT